MTKKRSSSKAWLKEHRDDPYVQQAQREGYRSRACYKLLELQDKDRLIRPGMTVLDLGSAPGGWSQVAVARVGDQRQGDRLGYPAHGQSGGCDIYRGRFHRGATYSSGFWTPLAKAGGSGDVRHGTQYERRERGGPAARRSIWWNWRWIWHGRCWPRAVPSSPKLFHGRGL